VTLADTGIGLSPEVRRRAFEPFFTTKEVGRGTGLGLTQVYGFARNTGGEVRIDSRSGEGARVTLLLPTSSVLPARETPPASARSDAKPTTRKLLVVDDNAEVRDVMATCLRECGYVVEEAEDAASALDRLAAGGIDAVVSDVVMPGVLDGFGLAREARRRWPGVPVLLVSGYATTLNEARAAGIPILAKPFTLPALAEVVSNLLVEERNHSAG
jgi:CheY-like chemotaxis protein